MGIQRGRRGFGRAAGNTLGQMGKGAATGAGIGAALGTIIPGAGNVIGAGLGAVIGAGAGLISGVATNLAADSQGKKAFHQGVLAKAQTADIEDRRRDRQERRNQRKLKNNIDTQDYESINLFSENVNPIMGSEGPLYKNNSGEVSIMEKYANNLNNSKRIRVGLTNT